MNHDTRTSNLRQLHCKTKQVSWLRLKSQREVGTKLLETSAPRSQRWQGNQMTHITSSKERISSQIEVQCSALCKSLNVAIYVYIFKFTFLSVWISFLWTQDTIFKKKLIQSQSEIFHFRLKHSTSFGMELELWSRTLHLKSKQFSNLWMGFLLFVSESAKNETTE